MKQIITTLLFCFLFGAGIGQDLAEEINNVKRSNILLVNTLIGSSKVGVGFRYKSLYRINDMMKIGWGAGIETFSSEIERNFIPLSIEAVGDVFDKGRTPFYMFSVGYGIPLKEDSSFASSSKGGLSLDISVGYRSKKEATQPFIALGYRLQHASYEGLDDFGNDNKIVQYKRWSLSIGSFF